MQGTISKLLRRPAMIIRIIDLCNSSSFRPFIALDWRLWLEVGDISELMFNLGVLAHFR